MTRWWLVDACAVSFSESVTTQQKICQTIRNSAPSGSASSKISSCTLDLIKKPVIINDLHLLTSFHAVFLFPYFKYLQLGYSQTGNTLSFQAQHLLVRCFLIREDIGDIKNGWKTHDVVKIFGRTYNVLTNNEKTIQELKFTHFLRYSLELLTINFKRWCENLRFLVVFSNQKTTTQVCKLILGRNNLTTGEYYNEDHGQIINIRKFSTFLQANIKQETIMKTRQLPVMRNNSLAISFIMNGLDIYRKTIDSSYLNIYLTTYTALSTNTQFTKRGFKVSIFLSWQTGRNQLTCSYYSS